MAREYEVVLLGATGYTGRLAAEYVTTHSSTDLKWAITGRSDNKLRDLVGQLKALNENRTPPGIQVAQLEKSDLLNLATKTKVLITTVGPYCKFGEVVLQACVETGTHYVDVTGESPWVLDMLQRYHDAARQSSAVIIPQCGVASAPADLMSWKLTSLVREKLGVGTTELVFSTHDINVAPSGGTLNTAFSLFDTYSLSDMAKSQDPWCLWTGPTTPQHNQKPLVERLTGVRTVSGLGTMTDSIQGAADVPIVHRSSALYGGKPYGNNFKMTAYTRTRNFLTGFGFHVAISIMLMLLILPPVRWFAKHFGFAPGEGATKEEASKEYIEWRGLATADSNQPQESKKALGRIRWDGSMYSLTAITSVEAAIVLARERTFAHELGGGILTPATLGEKYLERVEKAGLKMEFKIL